MVFNVFILYPLSLGEGDLYRDMYNLNLFSIEEKILLVVNENIIILVLEKCDGVFISKMAI